MSDIETKLADYFMCHFLATQAVAAGPRGRVGAKFLWLLLGDLRGRYLMTLERDCVSVVRVGDDEMPVTSAVIYWSLNVQDLARNLEGCMHDASARGEFVVVGEGKAKLARAMRAWSSVNMTSVMGTAV